LPLAELDAARVRRRRESRHHPPGQPVAPRNDLRWPQNAADRIVA
jgi:hypothetical protein